MASAHRHNYREIVFLCQNCVGDLEPTAELFDGGRVWLCKVCGARWIYTLAGWGRLPLCTLRDVLGLRSVK